MRQNKNKNILQKLSGAHFCQITFARGALFRQGRAQEITILAQEITILAQEITILAQAVGMHDTCMYGDSYVLAFMATKLHTMEAPTKINLPKNSFL